jgi:hypothetical protein
MNIVLVADSTVYLQQEYKESATVAHQSFEHQVRRSSLTVKGVESMQGFLNFSILDFFILSNHQ